MDTIGIIGAIATLLGGVWGLQIKQGRQNEKITQIFLGHLEKKNGILERVTENFNETLQGHQEVMSKVSEQLERANENTTNVRGVLDDCAHALHDYHKIVEKV